VQALGDSNVVLRVQGWIDQKESDFYKVRSEAQQQVKEAFDRAGIIMPEPIYNVNLRRQKKPEPEPANPDLPEPANFESDTQPDDAVTQQMEHERKNHPQTDLLSQQARTE
ncbi:MAG TPA: mechanosensitive ion channel family protein, partial [Xanthomonadales bacterium]|nr:mechanosensitive ion channel family protein [Xanthomonadales bacterium]